MKHRILINGQLNKPMKLYMKNSKEKIITELKRCNSIESVRAVLGGTELENFASFQYTLYSSLLNTIDITDLVIEDLLDLIA